MPVVTIIIIVFGSPKQHTVIHAYKDLVPSFRQPIPEVNPVEPLPERCFYENHAKKLKLWKAGKIPPYVNK